MITEKIGDVVAGEVLGMVGNLSDKNVVRALGVLEKLASIRWHHQGFDGIRNLVESKHAGIEGARRMIRQANPKARAALIRNFVLGCLLTGFKKRMTFYKRHNVAPPGTLMISPTMRCNLRCYGCYAGTHDASSELTFDETDVLVQEAYEAGTNFILILGGEPFMVPWLLDIVEKHPRMAFLIFTNGQLIRQQHIERLAAAGNAGVVIGVDGLEKDTDERKGKGSFERSMAAMRKVADAGIITGFSAMTSRRNFDVIHSDLFYDTMVENGATFSWVPIAVPQGSACFDRSLIPTEEQKARIPDLIRDIKKRKPVLIADFLTDAYITEGCGAGRILWHVNANGDVEPCVLMPFAVDNIRQTGFLDIIRSDFFKGIREIHRNTCQKSQTCMMVHRPREVLKVIQACGARETSKGTLEILHEMSEAQK